MRILVLLAVCLLALHVNAQDVQLVLLKPSSYKSTLTFTGPVNVTHKMGYEKNRLKLSMPKGNYTVSIAISSALHDTVLVTLLELTQDTTLDMDKWPGTAHYVLADVDIVGDAGSVFGRSNLKQVEGVAIYAGKKTEVIAIDQTRANLATNNGRQVFAKIAGLNIWESDAGGIQLGIGGRGLSPNRTANFNTRQNGYDISADALGYPESYYSPVPDFVNRIEVVRGASSLQYGTQFGGLVNFNMKQAEPDGRLHASGKYTAGSYDFLNLTHQLSYGTPKAGIYAAHQYKQGSGFRDYSGYENHSAFVNMYVQVKKRFRLGIDFTKMYYLAQQPGGLTDKQFYEDPYLVLRRRNWFKVNWNLAAVYADFFITEKTRLNTRFFGLVSDRMNVGYLGQINRPDVGQPRELIEGTFKNIGNETRLLTTYKWFKSYHTLLVGTRVYQGKTTASQGLAATQDGAEFNFKNPGNIDYSDYTFPSRNFSAFAENIFRLGSKFTITPGTRFEYIETKSAGYYYQRNVDLAGDTLLEVQNHTATQRTRSLFLAGIGVAYKPFKWIEFFANCSQNYRAINFSDIAIVNPNFKVDPNMQDESGYTLDGGFRGTVKSWLAFDVSAFYLAYNNRIGEIFKQDDFNYNIIRYRTNIGNSYNYGIESFAEMDLIKMINDSSKWSLPVFANYTYVQAYYRESDQYAVGGKQVEFVPNHMLRAGASIAYRGAYVSYNYSYLSSQYSDATNASVTTNAIYGLIPAYWVTDAGVGYAYKKLKAEVHVNNLTNNLYFTRRATAYPGPGIIPAELRSIYVSVQLGF